MSKKQRIVNWLNIFLLVINLSAFGTLLLMNNQGGGVPVSDDSDYFKSDEFLKEALHLTDEQYEKITSLDYRIFRVYQSILDMQCEYNFKLMNELSSENPNKQLMDSIARQIGNLHMGIKRQTIRHFMNVRSICTEDQTVLLNDLIKEMMKLEDQCKYCNKEYCARREELSR